MDLVTKFWSCEPGRSYKCRYPGHGDHYVDEILVADVDGETRAEWYLHGHCIAIYLPERHEVRISDRGYVTNLTYGRLDAILWRRGFSTFRMFLDHGWYGYGFVKDHANDMVYSVPSSGYLIIDLQTRAVSVEMYDDELFLAMPGDLFDEFAGLVRYLGRKYNLSLEKIFNGLPPEVESKLRKRTKEKIGFFRMFMRVNGDGNENRS